MRVISLSPLENRPALAISGVGKRGVDSAPFSLDEPFVYKVFVQQSTFNSPGFPLHIYTLQFIVKKDQFLNSVLA
jgi:hypothetical protein